MSSLLHSSQLIPSLNFYTSEPRSRITASQNGVRCNLLKYENGKPRIPILSSEQTTPSFLTSKSNTAHLENALIKNDTRLRIFSGTANPALSQVNSIFNLGSVCLEVKRFPNPPPLSSFSRGGYDRRDCNLRLIWASRWVSRWASRRSRWVLSRPDPVSAAQIRSQLSLCRPRSGLSWRGEGGAAPDPVSAGEEKAVGPCCWGVIPVEIACYMGLELGRIKIKRFADGEIYVQLQESVRGCDVYLVQPTCPPANENLMELLIMIDACRRASAKNITAVIPYFGYARADRKTQGRESIAAKLVANLITEAGANRVLACDLHSGQSMGYFDIPVDHVYGQPVILDYLASKTIYSDDLVVVSPDVGGVARARAFAKKLSDAPLAIVDKRRHGHNVAEVGSTEIEIYFVSCRCI
uniref:ribose-phosphate diphosphokinase n=1 Tax=Fagus sylvatica TaxID=28930 RepID=A0A2N9H5K3_FAGSY